MTGPYDDMIHLPHHISTTRPHMPIADRAAQFSPFAALTGHSAAIRETARLTDARRELGIDDQTKLNRQLDILAHHHLDHPEIAITYFESDETKDGGRYVTIIGALKKIDDHKQMIYLTDGHSILISDIWEIHSELLDDHM